MHDKHSAGTHTHPYGPRLHARTHGWMDAFSEPSRIATSCVCAKRDSLMPFAASAWLALLTRTGESLGPRPLSVAWTEGRGRPTRPVTQIRSGLKATSARAHTMWGGAVRCVQGGGQAGGPGPGPRRARRPAPCAPRRAPQPGGCAGVALPSAAGSHTQPRCAPRRASHHMHHQTHAMCGHVHRQPLAPTCLYAC